MEEANFGKQVREQEVERAESHDGHDVGGVGEEGMAGDGEDCRDGVEGEDDVGDLDGDEGEGKNGHHAAIVLADEEAILTQADGVDAGEPFEPAGCLVCFCGVFGEEEANGGYKEDGGEGVTDPVEAIEEADADGDERSAHDDGASDSPEENFRLAGGLDFEETEEQQEDEEVVYGEGLFDGVAGEVLRSGFRASGVEDEEAEGECGCDPNDRGDNRGGADVCGTHAASLATDIDKLDRQQGEDEEVKADPVADGGEAWHPVWMLQGKSGRMHLREGICGWIWVCWSS